MDLERQAEETRSWDSTGSPSRRDLRRQPERGGEISLPLHEVHAGTAVDDEDDLSRSGAVRSAGSLRRRPEDRPRRDCSGDPEREVHEHEVESEQRPPVKPKESCAAHR